MDAKMMTVALKSHFKQNFFSAEMYYHKKLLPELRRKYFSSIFHGYMCQTEFRFVMDNEDEVFHHTTLQYCTEMEYLTNRRWENLQDLKWSDDDRIDRVFRQLIHLQLELIQTSAGIYYDVSPYNVFVCKTMDKIFMVDYGGLFIPLNPNELRKGSLANSYRL